MQNKVSCIIPAHNEGRRIIKVLKVINASNLISEIIVVQNFSTDNTSKVVRDFIKKAKTRRIKLIDENEYPGKAYAMYKGVEASKFQILLFIDADLNGLNKKNIKDLVLPVINNKADVTIGFRGNALLLFKLIDLDPIGGERAIRKELFLEMPDYSNSSFAIESLMNDFLIKNNRRIKIIKMLNVNNTMKYKKRGFFKGWHHDMKMLKQIFSQVSLFKFIRIAFYLRKHSR